MMAKLPKWWWQLADKKVKTVIFWLALATLTSSTAHGFDPTSFLPDGVGRSHIESPFFEMRRTVGTENGSSLPRGYLEGGGMRLFELSELEQFHVAGGFRIGPVTTDLLYGQFGTDGLYLERSLSATIAGHIGPAYVGLRGSVLIITLPEGYGYLASSRYHEYAAIGGLIGANWRVNVLVENIYRPDVEINPQLRPVRMEASGAYAHTQRLTLLSSVYYEENRKLRFGVGQELRLHPAAALLIGLTVEPFSYGGGILTEWNMFSLRYATELHPVLGFSHAVTLRTQFGSRR